MLDKQSCRNKIVVVMIFDGVFVRIIGVGNSILLRDSVSGCN